MTANPETQMKTFIFLALILPLSVSAQSVDVKNVDTEGEGTTTIEIRKGKNDPKAIDATPAPAAPRWEVHDGTADIEGESGPLVTDAKKLWKTACEDWKVQFRKDNSENKILNVSCGSPTCSGDVGNKVCSSQATYKIKTKVDW